MVRAPCCEKMGLKKGPWTSEEDQILINYIKLYGHGNWRALPKQAGLLRCGKSCRLRWTNYLRPDIKRGNFTREEEETIIHLHEMLGNRWSAIAARLPGRTDNEIKNVWHTHLKKRLIQRNNLISSENRNYNILNQTTNYNSINVVEEQAQPLKFLPNMKSADEKSLECIQRRQSCSSSSPPHCLSESSSVITADNNINNNNNNDARPSDDDLSRNLLEGGDEKFWLEVLSNDYQNSDIGYFGGGLIQDQFLPNFSKEPVHETSSNMHETMDFWYNIFTRGGELPEIRE